MQDLERLAAELLETALKLSPSTTRNEILEEICGFRARIIALQSSQISSEVRAKRAAV